MHNQMKKLNSSIIQDFINLVEKEFKNKGKLSSEQIDRMQRLLKGKIKNTQNYLNDLTQNFIKRANKSEKSNQEEEGVDEKIRKDDGKESMGLTNKEKLIEQDEDDDLNQFKKSRNEERQEEINEQKKQEELNDQIKQEKIRTSQWDDQELDDDQNLSERQLKSLKLKIGAHILGIYNTEDKKFNSKKQSTKILLKNVFLKIQGHQQQVYFPSLQFVATKKSKKQLDI